MSENNNNKILLKSVDEYVALDDFKRFAELLPIIEKSFYIQFQIGSPNYQKIAYCDQDYYFIVNHLNNNAPDINFTEHSLGSRLQIKVLEK